MAIQVAFEARLSWDPNGGLTHRVVRGESFGLLECEPKGWMLCIPDGACALVDDRPIDLRSLFPEPSGERRFLLHEGARARVTMGQFEFSVQPAEA